ncbi:MAG: universal stress protein [Chloroflexota bacterium]
MTAGEPIQGCPPAFRRLLVPLDGSHLAEAVLPAVKELARRFGAEVVLLHVVEHNPPAKVHGEAHLTNVDQATAYLASLARQLAGEGLAVRAHVHADQERDLARSLVDHALELQGDLMVMATHGRGGLREVVVGSIAEQTLGRGQIPVLLLRPERVRPEAPFNIRRLLVPLDGSPAAERAVPLAEAVACAWDARMILLRVVPTPGSLPGHHAAVATILPSAARLALEIEETAAGDYLRALGEGLAERGRDVMLDVERGDPATVVVKEAGSNDADLVVLATHGRSGMDAFWEGSIGSRLSRRLTMPLLILRTERGEERR